MTDCINQMMRLIRNDGNSVLAITATAQTAFALILVFIGITQAAIYLRIRHDGIARDRAFVFVKSFHVFPMTTPSNRLATIAWRISPIWENTGNTPTRDMINYGNSFPTIGDLPKDFDFPDFVAPGAPIFERLLRTAANDLWSMARDTY
jgi:hypothetical protein